MSRCFNLLAIVLMTLAPAADVFAVGSPNVTGSILRDTSVGYFDFTIKITDVSKTALTRHRFLCDFYRLQKRSRKLEPEKLRYKDAFARFF